MRPRRRPPSLTGRLFRGLALVQVGVTTAALGIYAGLTNDLSPNELAHIRAAPILARAAEAGDLRAIAPLPELVAYLQGRTGLLYGVAVDGRWLEGSTLAADIGRGSGVTLAEGLLAVATPAGTVEGHATTAKVGSVPALIVTAGNAPDARDLARAAWVVAGQVAVLLGPLLAASLLITWWGLRRGLRPVAALARAAAAIDLDHTHRRLDIGGAPAELAPLARAFNLALERLSATFAARKRFLDNAAHELRTPLAVMRARVDAMPPGEERTLLQRDIRRLGALSDQLLASARLASDRAPAPVPVDLAALLVELVADYAPLAHDPGRAIGFARSGGPARVAGHPAALTAAFANLLDNALRVEPPGGCVEVRLEGGTRVLIEDHGPGIDPAARSLVFEPFWRGEEDGRGSGLGLAVVAEIVRHHGAAIRIEETAGGGATFVVAFPGEALGPDPEAGPQPGSR